MHSLGHQITILSNKIDPSLLDRFKHKFVPILKPFSFLKMLSFAFFARQAAKKNAYDLISSNERTIYQDIYFAGEGSHGHWLKQRFKQVSGFKKLLIRINPLHWTILFLEKLCLTHSRLMGVIAFSQNTKKELMAAHAIPSEKIKVVYHGIPPKQEALEMDRNTLRQDLGIVKDELVLLFVGSGFERKGLKLLIEGLAHFTAPNYRLLVVGKGSAKPYLKRAKKLNVDGKIRFLGHQSCVPPFYSIADIFILPTLYEPFGLVVLEAMLYEVPVIVSSLAGVSELIVDGENGLRVDDIFDARQIGACLNRLRDPELRARLAQAGKALAQVQTIEKSVLQTTEAVQEWLETKRAS